MVAAEKSLGVDVVGEEGSCRKLRYLVLTQADVMVYTVYHMNHDRI